MNNKALLNQNITSSKPFLKWAGGKTQLLPELRKHIPTNYGRYIEPFVGGGAFFFDLCPREAIISDSNEEPIITYKKVRDRDRLLYTSYPAYALQGVLVSDFGAHVQT